MNHLNLEHPAPRRAVVDDIAAIHSLLKSYSDAGNLLPRSTRDIEQNLHQFWVVAHRRRLAACAALEIFTPELGEVRSLAVSPGFGRAGLGSRMVAHIVDEAAHRGLKRLMALTYVPGFFHRLGFATVPKESLPEKVWGVCVTCYKFNKCDEIAVLRHL